VVDLLAQLVDMRTALWMISAGVAFLAASVLAHGLLTRKRER
jgi:aryl-alcohol dehydrogenase-like predicted oxidoreductase